jgi:hypothetical protein
MVLRYVLVIKGLPQRSANSFAGNLVAPNLAGINAMVFIYPILCYNFSPGVLVFRQKDQKVNSFFTYVDGHAWKPRQK